VALFRLIGGGMSGEGRDAAQVLAPEIVSAQAAKGRPPDIAGGSRPDA